jgi:hypothetical protein
MAVLAGRGADPRSLVTQYQRHPIAEVRIEQRGPSGIDGHKLEPSIGQLCERVLGTIDPQYRRREGHTRRCLDDQRANLGSTGFGDHDAIDPGARCCPQNHPQIGWVVDRIEHQHRGCMIAARPLLEKRHQWLHPWRSHVGNNTLVLLAVARNRRYSTLRDSLDLNAPLLRDREDPLDDVSTGVVGEVNPCNGHRTLERLEDRFAAVDSEVFLARRRHDRHRATRSLPSSMCQPRTLSVYRLCGNPPCHSALPFTLPIDTDPGVPMPKKQRGETLVRKERVKAAINLRDVPEGTEGRVILSNGLTWMRYWVHFDNGVEMGSLHRDKLVRVHEWDQFLIDRETASERAEAAAAAGDDVATEAGDGDDGEAADGGASVNGVPVPQLLLDRTKSALERFGVNR